MEHSSPPTLSPEEQNDPRVPLLGGRYHSESEGQHTAGHTIQSTYLKAPADRDSLDKGSLSGAEIRTYRWRWVVLAIFFLNLGINNSVWITIAPVADVMRCYYGISNTWVNATSTVYMAAYVLFFLPCAWILDRYGLKVTMVLASLTNALGTAVRVAGTGINSPT